MNISDLCSSDSELIKYFPVSLDGLFAENQALFNTSLLNALTFIFTVSASSSVMLHIRKV